MYNPGSTHLVMMCKNLLMTLAQKRVEEYRQVKLDNTLSNPGGRFWPQKIKKIRSILVRI